MSFCMRMAWWLRKVASKNCKEVLTVWQIFISSFIVNRISLIFVRKPLWFNYLFEFCELKGHDGTNHMLSIGIIIIRSMILINIYASYIQIFLWIFKIKSWTNSTGECWTNYIFIPRTESSTFRAWTQKEKLLTPQGL